MVDKAYRRVGGRWGIGDQRGIRKVRRVLQPLRGLCRILILRESKRLAFLEFVCMTMRHTCATLLLLSGAHPKVVAERLGHSTIVQTLDTYSHVLPTLQESAAESLERLMGGDFRQSAHLWRTY